MIIFLESFDGYDENTLTTTGGNFDNWQTDGPDDIIINDTYGRNGQAGARFITNSRTINSRANVIVRFSDYERIVVGCAIRIDSTNFTTSSHDLNWITDKVIWTAYYREVAQCSVVITPSMRLALVQGTLGATIARSDFYIKENIYYYVEVDLTVSNSLGAITARIDGKTRLSASAIDTDSANSGLCDGVRFGIRQLGEASGGRVIRFDHIYICEKTIPANQGFLGDLHIQGLRPRIDRKIQWTPSAGTDNWDLVNDLAPDDYATYSSSNAAGQMNLYGLTAPAVTEGSVIALASNYYVRKSKAGVVGVRARLTVAGTTDIGDTHYLQESWRYVMDIAQRTSVPSNYLALSAIAGGSVGIERVF